MSGSAGPGCVAPAGPSRGFERYDGYERYDALHADLQQREWPTIHNLFRRAVAGEAAAQAVLNIETPQPPMPAAWLQAQLEQDTRQASLTRKSHTLPISHPHATKPHFFFICFSSTRIATRSGSAVPAQARRTAQYVGTRDELLWPRVSRLHVAEGVSERDRHGSDRNGAEPNVRGDSRQALCCRANFLFLPSWERSKWRRAQC